MSDTKSQRIAKNTGVLFVRTLFALGLGLLSSRFILKGLGVDDFGIYNVIGSVIIFFSFLKKGLTNATFRYLAFEIGNGKTNRIKELFSMAINSHVLLSFTLFFIIEGIGYFYLSGLNIPDDRMDVARIIFHFTLVTFCVSIMQTPFNSALLAYEKMNIYSYLSIIEVVLKFSAALFLAYSPWDHLLVYGFSIMSISIIVLIFNILACTILCAGCHYVKIWEKKIIEKFVKYSGWSVIVNVADVTSSQCMNIFFNLFIGVIANAALGVANQVISAMNQFVGTFTQAFEPQIIKSYAAKEYEYFHSLIHTTSKISFTLLLLICTPVLINIEFLLQLWLGEYPSATPLYIRIIIVYSLMDALQSPLYTAVHATGNLKVHQIIIGTLKLLVIPFSYFVFKLGFGGAAALSIWASMNIVAAIVRTLYMKYLISFDVSHYLYGVVLRLLLMTVVIISLTYILSCCFEAPLLTLCLTTIFSVVFIMLFSFYVTFDMREREFVISFSKKLLHQLKHKRI